jgi:hypothetical protein
MRVLYRKYDMSQPSPPIFSPNYARGFTTPHTLTVVTGSAVAGQATAVVDSA